MCASSRRPLVAVSACHLLFAVLPGAMAAAGPIASAPADACPLYLVRYDPDHGFALDSLSVADGTVEVLSRAPGTDLVDVILPVGPGGSGSLVTRGDGALLVVRCRQDALELQVRLPSGENREWPVRPLEELRTQNVRVSVKDGAGERAAFVIEEWSRVYRDSVGPVKDPFGDMVPMGGDDVVVFTETYPHSTGPAVEGEVPVAVDGQLRVPVRLERPAEMFLDLGGAGLTLVGRSYLADSVEITPVNMVEYSAAGRRLLDYAPGGATGSVTGIEGIARLPVFQVGPIEFRDLEVLVMMRLPDWFPDGVAGIVGLDLVRRASVVGLEVPAAQGEEGRLVLAQDGPVAPVAEGEIRVPFVLATHLFVRGTIGGRDVHLILDTGAPRSFLDEGAIEALGLTPESAPRTVRGLDEQGAEVVRSAADLELGGMEFSDVTFEVGALAPFTPIRNAGQIAGLLGNAFFQRFARIEIDFARRWLTFVPRS